MLLLDAAIPTRAQETRAESGIKSNFPDHFQDSGLDSFATHTSGHTMPGISLFPLTGLTTVAPSLIREELRFASIVPHNLLVRSGSQDVSARVSSVFRRLVSKGLTFGLVRILARTGTGKPGLLAEPIKYINRLSRSSTAFWVHLTFQELIGTFARLRLLKKSAASTLRVFQNSFVSLNPSWKGSWVGSSPPHF